MPAMNMIQAVNSAMAVMLSRDPKVVVFGEDVGYFGGVFRATEGLQRPPERRERHLEDRVEPVADANFHELALG